WNWRRNPRKRSAEDYLATRDVGRSHSLIVRSLLAEITDFPSGVNRTQLTVPVCPLNVTISLRLAQLHSFTAPFECPVARTSPFGEEAMDQTLPARTGMSTCCWPVATSHKRMLWSIPHEASVWPSGENA